MNETARELASIIDKYSITDGIHITPLQGVKCIRLSNVGEKLPAVYNPSVCFVVQGSKQVLLEDDVYEYGPSQYFAVSIDLPVLGLVQEASPGKPYLCIQIDLDPMLVSDLISADMPVGAQTETRRGMFVGQLNAPLLDAVLRMARLLDTPADVPLLVPMLLREIHYRILRGEHGHAIAQMAINGSNTQKIAQVIQHLKQNLNHTFATEDLATMANMSPSSFHAHFKAVTAMSPLQYHKRLRLNQARHLMLTQHLDATTAAYRIGYESPSQFSREYARMFGQPPVRDTMGIRNALSGA